MSGVLFLLLIILFIILVSSAGRRNGDEDLHPGVFLAQVAGEYEERCKSSGLELVVRHPETAENIMADGRKLWRIFDNLFGNAVKYSLPGSRVYADLTFEDGKAIFILRNTSKIPVSAAADELTERFVRGDTARNTEGNGLGLSIADSLTELLNGKMTISVDGDLFKVILSFPIVME